MANLNTELSPLELTAAVLRGLASAITVTANNLELEEKAQKVKKAAPKKEVLEDLPQETESDDIDLGSLDDEMQTETKVTLSDVIRGFQVYAKEKGKDKAAKVLAKYKVKSVRELKAENYAKVLSEIEV